MVSCLELQTRTDCSGRGRPALFLLLLSCVVVVVVFSSPDLSACRGGKGSLLAAGCRTFLPLTLVTGVLNEAVVVVGRDDVSVVVASSTQTACVCVCVSVLFIGPVMAAQDV